MENKNIDIKYLVNSIDSFIDEICSVQLDPSYVGNKYQDKYKHIVILLEECKINLENNRYDNLHKVEDLLQCH